MKPSEMKTIYEEACRTAVNRPIPDAAQAKMWLEILGVFDAADVRGGLVLWWRSRECNEQGELKSKWLPAPAELEPLCERARRAKASDLRGSEEFSAWRCSECGTGITSFQPGFSPRECRGRFGSGPDCGKACTSQTFRLLYRGAAA